MGRPTASKENKALAVAIASLATKPTNNPEDIVARCGSCSLFIMLKSICPIIVRDWDMGPRDGVSEVELNKALQVNMEAKINLAKSYACRMLDQRFKCISFRLTVLYETSGCWLFANQDQEAECSLPKGRSCWRRTVCLQANPKHAKSHSRINRIQNVNSNKTL
jgi:hypothetical protein